MINERAIVCAINCLSRETSETFNNRTNYYISNADAYGSYILQLRPDTLLNIVWLPSQVRTLSLYYDKRGALFYVANSKICYFNNISDTYKSLRKLITDYQKAMLTQ